MFCLGKGSRAYLSQYIGNLKNPETQQFYNDTIFRFMQLLRIEPEMIVTDLHPEYFSTKLGHNLAQTLTSEGKRITIERVQHHHAHIASCMAEHQLDEQVIGVAFDGTGYGSDGHIWGSEFMLADLETFQRTNHFEYLPMPGGDKAAEEPWRMAISALVMAFGKDLNKTILSILSDVKPQQSEWIIKMIRNRVNTPMTCGAGRYFDAVAALLGIITQAGYEGEGPMKLEALTREGIDETYEIELGPVISFIPAFRAITQEILNGYDPGLIATKFHNTVVLAIVESAMDLHKRYSVDKVVLSGGVFQNKYLVERVVSKLQRNQLRVYIHAAVPPNDGGVALGQLIVAAKRREKYVFGCTGKSD
jgi:hydrogenase maturation protein HypF